MKKILSLSMLGSPAFAHSGAGSAAELFHVHGAEYLGAGLVALALLGLPLLVRAWRSAART